MKNFRQTPKQRKDRKAAFARTKEKMVQSKPAAFQPKEAWGSHRKVGGGHLDLLEHKQIAAGHGGYRHSFFNPWW
jgi:hypothetical protein